MSSRRERVIERVQAATAVATRSPSGILVERVVDAYEQVLHEDMNAMVQQILLSLYGVAERHWIKVDDMRVALEVALFDGEETDDD